TTRTSEPLDMRRDAPAQRRVGKRLGGRGDVLADVVDARRRRDDAGDGRVRDDELQEKLRPARAADLGGPWREGVPLEPADERALPEGPVDDDADPPLLRERQDARFDLPVEDVVGDLDEIDPLAAHDALDLGMAPP